MGVSRDSNNYFKGKKKTHSNKVLHNSDISSNLSPLASPPPAIFLSSHLITHHCEGHELQDAPAAPLLQALNALLNETLHKLRLRACHFGAHDGRNKEEEVGWGEQEREGANQSSSVCVCDKWYGLLKNSESG